MSTALPDSVTATGGKRKISPLVFIFLTIFIDLLGIGLLIPVLPYIVAEYRTDATTFGLLGSSYAIAQFLASPVLGAISDRVGRRPVLLFSMLGTSLGYYIFGMAGALWILFASRILDGITGGVVGTAQAYIADVTPPEQRAKNFGLVGAAVGLGFVFGPALGGALAHYGLRTPVFFSAGFALCNATLGFFTLPESLVHREESKLHWRDLNPFRSLIDLFSRTSIRPLVTGFFSFNFAFAGFTSIFSLFAKNRFHWTPADIGSVFLVVGIVLAIVQGGLIRRLIPIFGEPKLVITGLTIAVICFCLIPVIEKTWLFYLNQGSLAFGVGMAMPSLRAGISNRASGREQGRVIGGMQSLVSLGQVVGPLWSSFVYDLLGPSSPFFIAAALSVLCLVLIAPKLHEPLP